MLQPWFMLGSKKNLPPMEPNKKNPPQEQKKSPQEQKNPGGGTEMIVGPDPSGSDSTKPAPHCAGLGPLGCAMPPPCASQGPAALYIEPHSPTKNPVLRLPPPKTLLYATPNCKATLVLVFLCYWRLGGWVLSPSRRLTLCL